MKKRIKDMKKIKFILINICLILLSGCTATYEINIKDDKIIEKLSLIETNTTLFDKVSDTGFTLRETFDGLLNENDIFSKKNYNVKSLNTDNQLGIEYSSSWAKSILNSSILNQCYDDFNVSTRDGIVTVETGNNFKCYEYYENLDSIKIIFKTNHKVINTNSQKKEGNSYIWNFSKDGNKNIRISYYENEINKSIDVFTIVLIVVLVCIVGFIGFLFIKKMQKNNKI